MTIHDKIEEFGFVLSEKGRSPAYFAKNNNQTINNELLKLLVQTADERDLSALRLCLNASPDDALHNMVIYLRRAKYLRPHLHPEKAETYHILYGEMDVLLFSDDGVINSVIRLARGKTEMVRVDQGSFHLANPVSQFVVFHESQSGPFIGEKESIWPEWAPEDRRDPRACALASAISERT